MKEWIVDQKQAGGRIDKFLKARLKEAPDSFFYKMARKKNLTLNGQKCKGNEILKEGDEIRLYVSDATIALFEGSAGKDTDEYFSAYKNLAGVRVLKETDDLVFLYKPSGILSQKAKESDESLNEWLVGYLLQNCKITKEELKTFVPSVLNRLDRNTSGIVIGGKTLRGSRFGSKLLKDGIVRKFYYCITDAEDFGKIKTSQKTDETGRILLCGYLLKDETLNKVKIYRTEDVVPESKSKEAKAVSISVKELSRKEKYSLLEVELHSGKSHQIRALLSEYKAPISGDLKYGKEGLNNDRRMPSDSPDSFGQLLCASRVEIPKEAAFNEPWMEEYKGISVEYIPDFAKDYIS